MSWTSMIFAAALAGLSVLAFPIILRRLPLPPDEPTAAPYGDLISRRFGWQVGLWCLLALGISFALTPPGVWLAWAALGTGGILLVVIDAHTRLLPLRLTQAVAICAAAGVGIAALQGGSTEGPRIALSAAGMALGAGGLFFLFWRLGQGIGFGDVRLAAIIGAVAGATSLQTATWALLLGSLVGVGWGVTARLVRGHSDPFPYGPSLLSGPYLALLAQSVLAR
ncbi:MAG: prepilin peptidase [Propionicimonas sp.]